MSFAGVPAAQIPIDYYLWECVLNGNPHLKGIVELGTWQGGFSLFLDAQAKHRGISFITYDVVVPDKKIPHFVQLDIFAEQKRIGTYIQRKNPVALFCDGGNKPRELKIFSQFVSPDSVILVHDWMTEVFPDDVPDWVEEIYGDFCDSIGSMTRVFKLKDLV